jgi:hypothetical protein
LLPPTGVDPGVLPELDVLLDVVLSDMPPDPTVKPGSGHEAAAGEGLMFMYPYALPSTNPPKLGADAHSAWPLKQTWVWVAGATVTLHVISCIKALVSNRQAELGTMLVAINLVGIMVKLVIVSEPVFVTVTR